MLYVFEFELNSISGNTADLIETKKNLYELLLRQIKNSYFICWWQKTCWAPDENIYINPWSMQHRTSWVQTSVVKCMSAFQRHYNLKLIRVQNSCSVSKIIFFSMCIRQMGQMLFWLKWNKNWASKIISCTIYAYVIRHSLPWILLFAFLVKNMTTTQGLF